MPEKEIKKEVKEKESMWELGRVPVQFEPGIVKGDEVLDVPAALVRILNNQEKILKIVGSA